MNNNVNPNQDQQYTPFAPNNEANGSSFAPRNPYIDQNGSYGDFDRPMTYVQSPSPAQKSGALRQCAFRALGFGIAALITAHAWPIAFLGIIFGAIAGHNAKRVLSIQNHPNRICAVLGRIFGKIGFILGIVLTSLVAFVLLVGLTAAV